MWLSQNLASVGNLSYFIFMQPLFMAYPFHNLLHNSLFTIIKKVLLYNNFPQFEKAVGAESNSDVLIKDQLH